jgi:hypothetical protein
MKMTEEEERVMSAKHAAAMQESLQVEIRLADRMLYSRAWEEELHPKPRLDGMLRPCVLMRREHHRLLRAVALKRAQKAPGEQPSIGAVLGELIERYRSELKREAGALFKRELAKKS